jgi:hypothetical protein
MNDLNCGVIDIDDVSNRLAPKFMATFSSLLSVMEIQEMKDRAKRSKEESQPSSIPVSSSSTIAAQKRPPQSPISTVPAKRTRSRSDTPSPPPEPKTPDQPTRPQNSDFTGSSTASKDEEHTKKLLFQLLLNTLGMLEGDFRRITWQRSGYRVELSQTLLSYDVDADLLGREIIQNFF